MGKQYLKSKSVTDNYVNFHNFGSPKSVIVTIICQSAELTWAFGQMIVTYQSQLQIQNIKKIREIIQEIVGL